MCRDHDRHGLDGLEHDRDCRGRSRRPASVAEGRQRRAFLPREEWARSAQGKKVRRWRCGPERRRRSRSRSSSHFERPCGFRVSFMSKRGGDPRYLREGRRPDCRSAGHRRRYIVRAKGTAPGQYPRRPCYPPAALIQTPARVPGAIGKAASAARKRGQNAAIPGRGAASASTDQPTSAAGISEHVQSRASARRREAAAPGAGGIFDEQEGRAGGERRR